jgi:hypothetical protein
MKKQIFKTEEQKQITGIFSCLKFEGVLIGTIGECLLVKANNPHRDLPVGKTLDGIENVLCFHPNDKNVSYEIKETSRETGFVLHIKETHVDSVYGRIFEGWISGQSLKVFGSLGSTHCAMTSGQAIAYKAAVEKRAFETSIEVETVFDFLS